VPLHPSENVVVRGAITDTALPLLFVTCKFPLYVLKAMPVGMIPYIWCCNSVCSMVDYRDRIANLFAT
jgi:hypothetical protein